MPQHFTYYGFGEQWSLLTLLLACGRDRSSGKSVDKVSGELGLRIWPLVSSSPAHVSFP